MLSKSCEKFQNKTTSRPFTWKNRVQQKTMKHPSQWAIFTPLFEWCLDPEMEMETYLFFRPPVWCGLPRPPCRKIPTVPTGKVILFVYWFRNLEIHQLRLVIFFHFLQGFFTSQGGDRRIFSHQRTAPCHNFSRNSMTLKLRCSKPAKCQLPGFFLHQLVPRTWFATPLFYLEKNKTWKNIFLTKKNCEFFMVEKFWSGCCEPPPPPPPPCCDPELLVI